MKRRPLPTELKIYLPRVAGPTLAAVCLASIGLGMALTPPSVPAPWRAAGLGLLAVAGVWLAMLVYRLGRTRGRLERAARLLGGEAALTARVAVVAIRRGHAYADVAAVRAGDDQHLAAWPLLPEGAEMRRGNRPAWRIPVLPPPADFMPLDKPTLQADVFVAPGEPGLVLIRTRNGCLLSLPGL